MRRDVLRSLKELFSFGGANVAHPEEPGSPYFNSSEKRLLRLERHEAHASMREAGEKRGYKVRPRAALRKSALNR